MRGCAAALSNGRNAVDTVAGPTLGGNWDEEHKLTGRERTSGGVRVGCAGACHSISKNTFRGIFAKDITALVECQLCH